MKNYIQYGDALDAVAPAGGVLSGQPLAIGKLFGVAAETVPAGVVFALHRRGVFGLPKPNGQAWAMGDPLFWDAAGGVVTNTNSGSLLPVGWAAGVAASLSSNGPVLIGQSPS